MRGPAPRQLRLQATQFFKVSQWWRAVGNTVSDLTGLRFETRAFRSRDGRVIARLTRLLSFSNLFCIEKDKMDLWCNGEKLETAVSILKNSLLDLFSSSVYFQLADTVAFR